VGPPSARPQYGEHGFEDWRLRGHKALQIERIGGSHLYPSFSFHRARLGDAFTGSPSSIQAGARSGFCDIFNAKGLEAGIRHAARAG
jgi:hypothetical protein